MSFFHEKMSQNFWATHYAIWARFFFRASQRLPLISSTAGVCIAHLGIITTSVNKT